MTCDAMSPTSPANATHRRRTFPARSRCPLPAWPLALCALLFAATLGGCASLPTHSATRPTVPRGFQRTRLATQAGVAHGALFGGSEPLATAASSLGRKLALVRAYYRVGESFPTPTDRALMSQGTSVLVSLDLPPGMDYRAVTSGRENGTIRAFLESLARNARRYGLKAVYLCFEHEPDTAKHGAHPGAFISAWDHVHALAASMRLDWQQGGPIHWVWILTHEAFAKGLAEQYWPGSSRVDIVGEDAYNTSGCKKAPPGSNFVAQTAPVAPAELFGQGLSFAKSKRRPFFITEWGSVPGPTPTARGEFIRAVGTYVRTNRDIFALLYWDGHGPHNGCDYSLNTAEATLRVMKEVARSEYLAGVLAH